MGELQQTFLGRQPILNRRLRIVGYQLLFRHAADACPARVDDDVAASSNVIVDVLTTFGADALLGPALGFIHLDRELLLGPLIESLPAGRFVFEIPPLEDVDADFVKRCRELKRRKLTLCLDGFVRRDPREELVEYAAYAKVDASREDRELRQLAKRLGRANVQLVANRVETPEQFERLNGFGVPLFQGYFFAKPATVSGARIDPERTSLLQLMSTVQDDPDFDDVAVEVKRNPQLSVNLLRLVNGLELARSQKIASVSQALMMIGHKGLSRWLNILLFAGGGDEGPTSPLFTLAATRGRVMETIAEEIRKEYSEPAFLTGMLSLIDVLLGVPMEQMLREVSVDPDVREALLERSGFLGSMLQLMEAIERNDHAAVSELEAELELAPQQRQRLQVEAYGWVRGLGGAGA